MPAYPIEIISFGNPSFDLHHYIIKELNSIQTDFIFVLPPKRYANWAAPFARDVYEASYVWDKLREYRTQTKGFHPFIIAIVHGSLSDEKLDNLFGSREGRDGFAVVTTKDWESFFAPPSLSVFLSYYFIRYTLNFICPDIETHEETRGCFFDLKLHKKDIKLSMKEGRICDPCRRIFENAIDGDTYNSLTTLIKYLNDKANLSENLPLKKPKVFIVSSSAGLKIAEYLQAGLDSVTESTIWSQGIFGLTGTYLESLVKSTTQYDYAIAILTPDDLITKKGQTGNIPRDNVIFELGLFIGSIGRDHTFIVKCRDDELDLPSDLDGVKRAEFNRRSNGRLQAALAPVCLKLKEAMGISL